MYLSNKLIGPNIVIMFKIGKVYFVQKKNAKNDFLRTFK